MKKLLFSCLWILIGCLWILQANTGVADNGDFFRSIGWLLEKPVGLSTNIPQPGSPEWPYRFFHAWNDRWEYRETLELPYSFSSLQLLLGIGVVLNKALLLPYFSVTVLGIFSRILLFFLLLFLARKLFSSAWPLWGGLLALIVVDSRYISLLNSFYQEHASILFFIFLSAMMCALAENCQVKTLTGFLFALVLFSTSKMQFLFTPLCLLPWLAVIDVKEKKKAILISLLILQIVLSWQLVANKYSTQNSYNAFFSGALFFNKTHLPDWLPPGAEPCIGVSVWVKDCRDLLAREVGMRDVLALYASHPASFLAAAGYVAERMNNIDFFIAMTPHNNDLPTFHDARIFTFWTQWKKRAAGNLFYLEAAALLACFCLLGKTDRKKAALLAFGLFFVGTQILICLLGEGTVDLEKHLFMANFSLDLSLLVALAGLFEWAIRRRFARGPAAVHPWLPQFARFVLVGAVGTAMHYAILLAGVQLLALPAAYASAVGFIGGAITNYFFNYFYTFASSGAHFTVGRRFAVIALFGWFANLLLMTFFVHVVGWHYLFAQVLTTLLCLFFNYAGNRLWAFREARI